jgi:ribose-phosphate pyrophosphokinase
VVDGLLVILGPDDHHRSADIARGIPQIRAVRSVFPDGEQLVTVANPEAIPGRHVLIVQTTAPAQDVRLMTAYQLAGLAAATGAASVTCFLPYLCYQRQDKIGSPGQALSASIVLSLLRSVGARAVITVDRHSAPSWDGQPHLPEVVSLSCAEPLAALLKAQDEELDFVVATDRGGTRRASQVAEALGVQAVTLDKLKSATRGTYYEALPRRLGGRRLLVVDDVCTSGSTIRPLCAELAAMGARLTVFITHVVPTPRGRVTRIDGVDRFLCSDSCGDPAALVRLMPLALIHWTATLAKDGGPRGVRADAAV